MHQALVTASGAPSPAAEAFQQLRAAIEFAQPPIRVIGGAAATSVVGANTVLPNLAIALAQAGHRVIVVDANLGAPSQHTLFDLDNSTGITSVIAEEIHLEGALQESGVPGLGVLLAGPSKGGAGLPPMEAALLINDLKKFTDYIVVAMPPVLEDSNALAFAPLVDGTLLILRAGQSTSAQAERAKAMLQQIHANVLGIVFTNAAQ